MVQGGYNAAVVPGDSVERHFMDTINGGRWLPNQDMAWKLCATAGVGPTTSAMANASVDARLETDDLRVITTSWVSPGEDPAGQRDQQTDISLPVCNSRLFQGMGFS